MPNGRYQDAKRREKQNFRTLIMWCLSHSRSTTTSKVHSLELMKFVPAIVSSNKVAWPCLCVLRMNAAASAIAICLFFNLHQSFPSLLSPPYYSTLRPCTFAMIHLLF